MKGDTHDTERPRRGLTLEEFESVIPQLGEGKLSEYYQKMARALAHGELDTTLSQLRKAGENLAKEIVKIEGPAKGMAKEWVERWTDAGQTNRIKEIKKGGLATVRVINYLHAIQSWGNEAAHDHDQEFDATHPDVEIKLLQLISVNNYVRSISDQQPLKIRPETEAQNTPS